MSKVSSKDGIIATNAYSYDEQNRLTETVATTTGSSAEVHTYFGYDNNGNQISKWVQSVGVSDGENSVTLGELGVNAADGMALYSYDNFNRLTGILQGNTTIQNAYNGRGRKISRTTDGETRYYVYDGNTVIAELDGQNELKARNVYGRNLISRTTDKPMIMSYNGHGDIVLVRSVSGETLAEYAYDEFGNVLAQNGELDNPYRYAGYEYLDSIDLYDLNARYYNPKTARFLSEDPYFNLGNRVIGLYEINVPSVLSIMQANALYAYCGENPVKFMDTTGNAYEAIENMLATLSLKTIAYKQYKWMILASSNPIASSMISTRIDHAISQVVDNKTIVNSVSSSYLVRADIMGGIIFKEQLTQSIPDWVANIDTQLVTHSTHSVGPAAINVGLARSAWKYTNIDVYNNLPKDDAQLQAMLTEPDFNIQTLAASLRYIAGNFHNISLEEMQMLTDEQWKWIINDYNNANSYNEKVIEYLPDIRELLD